MAGDRFEPPHVGLNRIYTRAGDKGDTALVGGQRVPKDDLRLEVYGTVDELNAVVGLCRAEATQLATALLIGPATGDAMGADPGASIADIADHLLRVQHQLFNLGSTLATLPQDIGERQPRVGQPEIDWLEQEMDRWNGELSPLRSFVLPGPDRLNGLLHLARTVCRRAERLAVTLRRDGGCGDDEIRYLNRLSDALFVLSRWAVHRIGGAETLWEPDRA